MVRIQRAYCSILRVYTVGIGCALTPLTKITLLCIGFDIAVTSITSALTPIGADFTIGSRAPGVIAFAGRTIVQWLTLREW